jgi:hypothetical protein
MAGTVLALATVRASFFEICLGCRYFGSGSSPNLRFFRLSGSPVSGDALQQGWATYYISRANLIYRTPSGAIL